jgi:rare lipoprotein A
MKSRLLSSILFCVLIVLVFMGCDKKSSNDQTEVIQTGVASWYGPGFHGRLTSSRDRFSQDSLTAAHRTLPFNTILKVVNTETNESVEVRINDRGPYAQNRVIDLSKAAADEIGMLDHGVAEVDLILIEAGGPIPDNLNQPTYTIQLGEYNLPSYAGQFADSIGDGARVEQRFRHGSDGTAYMIYYGSYNTLISANSDMERLREQGFEGFVRQINE